MRLYLDFCVKHAAIHSASNARHPIQAQFAHSCGFSYPACQEQPSAVGCSVVGKTHRDAIFGQLVRVSGAHNVVSFDLCIGDLDRTETEW